MLIGTALKTKKSRPNGNHNSTYNMHWADFCAQERLSQKRILAFPKNSLMSLRQCNLICCDFDRYKRVHGPVRNFQVRNVKARTFVIDL